MAARSYAFAMLFALTACKSAQEKCNEGRAAALSAWQARIAGLTQARKLAIDTEAASQLELSGKIEPRTSAAAAKAASARYERSDDAWQRAYVAAQNAACSADPDCTRVRHAAAEALDQQKDIDEKLSAASAVRTAVASNPALSKQLTDAVIPEQGSQSLDRAKQATAHFYEACKDLK